jgi:FkbM family methyltransferase
MINAILNKIGIYRAPKLFKRLLLEVNANDRMLDIGANVGFYSGLMGKTKGKVYSYEPNPYAYKRLEKMTSKYKNVTTFNKAVSCNNTEMKLFLHENHEDNPIKWSTGSSLDQHKANVSNDYVKVDVVDIRDLLEDTYKIIKIDVEGHEIEILNRIFELKLTNRFEHMFVEMHDHKMVHLSKESDLIRKYVSENNLDKIHLDWH